MLPWQSFLGKNKRGIYALPSARSISHQTLLFRETVRLHFQPH